mmetsp:Transcript_19685/g.42832  ORF Transcript_19685/g.42832 Transcript_19685/m.42832 type:complete len:261 (+) Transcript_19685:266-1048(+)
MSEPDNIAQEQSQVQDSLHSTTSGTSRRSSLNSKGVSRRASLRRRSSGLFAAARASFVRSRGQSGANVDTLRGNTGADFEGYATVHRGDGNGAFAMFDLFSCFGKKKDGLYFLLIKGYHCFVFKDEEAKSPKFAIELTNRKAVIQPSRESFIPHVPHPGADRNTTYTTIHLETGLGDIEYKFTFANMEDGLASKFCDVVSAASNEAITEQVRKRLGHEGLLSKRASVRYANTIGAEKTRDQPEAPVGTGEVLAEMPVPGY